MALNSVSYVLSKKYTEETADTLGSLKGAPCQIQKIVKVDGTSTVTFLWEGTSGATQTGEMTVLDGLSFKALEIVNIDGKDHLIATLEDDRKVDAGVMPSVDVAISKEEGNALKSKDDGLYVPATGVEISKEEGNILQQKDDGLYAKADEIKISAKEGNILENITDEGDDNGLYVPETPIVDEFGDDPSDENVPSEKLVKDSLDAIDDRIDEIELFKFPNAVIVGAPSIKNGQISNFSTANYMKFPFLMDFKGRPFKIKMEFTTGSNVTAQENIFDSNFGLAFAIRDAKFVIAVSSNGTSWDVGEGVGSVAVQPNTSYMVELAWDGISYTLDYSTDGGESYLNDILKASDKSPYPKQIYIGVGQLDGTIMNAFSGIINFNFAELYVNNVLVWQGMDDVGLATRLATDLGNIDAAGIAKIEEIAGIDDYVKKTAIVKAFNASTSDEKVPSEKLVKDSLDKKVNIEQKVADKGKALVVGEDGKLILMEVATEGLAIVDKTQAEYDALTDEEKNDPTIVYNITDADDVDLSVYATKEQLTEQTKYIKNATATNVQKDTNTFKTFDAIKTALGDSNWIHSADMEYRVGETISDMDMLNDTVKGIVFTVKATFGAGSFVVGSVYVPNESGYWDINESFVLIPCYDPRGNRAFYVQVSPPTYDPSDNDWNAETYSPYTPEGAELYIDVFYHRNNYRRY